MTYLPSAEMTRAPAGGGVVAAGPMRAIRPPLTMIVTAGCAGAPVPSISVPPTIARSFVWAIATDPPGREGPGDAEGYQRGPSVCR